jgi:hypothetical protein
MPSGRLLPRSFHGYAEFADKQERELKANRHDISFQKESDKKSSSKPQNKTHVNTESAEKDEDGAGFSTSQDARL